MAGKRAYWRMGFIGPALIIALLAMILSRNSTPPTSERREPPEPVKQAEEDPPSTNPKLLEAFHDGLKGRSKPEDWEKLWTGGHGKPDWVALEAEWRAYIKALP